MADVEKMNITNLEQINVLRKYVSILYCGRICVSMFIIILTCVLTCMKYVRDGYTRARA